MVAEVRDDPAGRIRCAADAYAFGRGGRRYRPYRRAVVAFMRWQQARGVLNSLDDDIPGSPWWRAVNEGLLRDTVEAKLLVERGEGQPSRPTVARWVDFFNAPSARSWYEAHNASVVAGYLAHSDARCVRGARRAILHERRAGAGVVRARAGARRRPRAGSVVVPRAADRSSSVAGSAGVARR